MSELSIIAHPIERELQRFADMLAHELEQKEGLLGEALKHIDSRRGKQMRPILILLIAKSFGDISVNTIRAAVSLELLHTASLVHDDVIDKSDKRRGQPSLNAIYGNKVAVLSGDYLLSMALSLMASTNSLPIMSILADLGCRLSQGEMLELESFYQNRHNRSITSSHQFAINGSNQQGSIISEETYYKIISDKTAALFEACTAIGATSSGAKEDVIAQTKCFGHNLGMAFQIRDDIFDYYENSSLGKPTGTDLVEGKFTLPIIYALKHKPDDAILSIVSRVMQGEASQKDIKKLVSYAKNNGGIEYAKKRMSFYSNASHTFVGDAIQDKAIADSLHAFIDYVTTRNI